MNYLFNASYFIEFDEVFFEKIRFKFDKKQIFYNNDEVEVFYEHVSATIQVNHSHFTIGDFNTKIEIWLNLSRTFVGTFGSPERNEEGYY